MNSISAWSIFCQSMLANIDGEIDYPELDYQFDQFVFCYNNNQRLFLEKAPCLTLYKLASGYEEKEFYGEFLDEIESIEELGFISAKIELIISFFWKLYEQEDCENEEYSSSKLDKSLLNNLNCTFEEFISYIRSSLENKNIKLSDKIKIIQLIKTIDDSLINSSSYIITYPNGVKRLFRVDDKIDEKLLEFINKVNVSAKDYKNIAIISIYLNNLKDIYFEKYLSVENLNVNEFLKCFDLFYKKYKENYSELIKLASKNIYIKFLIEYNCF